MTVEFLSALCGVTSAGFLGLFTAILLGQLVPSSRVSRAQAEADKWHKAYDALNDAHETQSRMLDRAQISAEITDKVMDAVRAIQGPSKE